MVEMKVLGLTMDSGTKAPILVLRTVEGEDVLPLWIGGVEAMSISLALSSAQAERPLTHDLLIRVLEGVNATISGVTITDVKDGIFYAMLDIMHGASMLSIDCRPSDGIALALRAQAPIRAVESVIAHAPVDRYRQAMAGKTFTPDETGGIVLPSLKQMEDLLRSNRQLAGAPAQASQGDVPPSRGKRQQDPGQPATAGEGERAAGSLAVTEEEELLSQMLRDLEPASKHRM